MEDSSGRLIGEIAFYVAIGVLIALFLIKKYRQARTAEKDSLNNHKNQ